MKKDQYFNDTNLEQISRDIFGFCADAGARSRHTVLQPNKTALLVLDMQKYFFEPASHAYIPSAKAIIPGVSRLVAFFISQAFPIIFTKHTNDDRNAGSMARWWNEILSPDTEDSELIKDFQNQGPNVMEKHQYDAFFQTPLHDRLSHLGIRQVIITGVMTHLCCESTARSAFSHGYDVFFPVDGTATYNLALHKSAVCTVAHGFGAVDPLDDLLVEILT